MTAETPQTSLLTRAEAGDEYDTPPLATCSYWEYRRGMGTAVNITLYAPRGISLPDPRWTDQPRWPAVRLLAPGREYFHKGLPPEVFRDHYLDDLNQAGGKQIAAALRAVPVEDGCLVLLCFCKPSACHRRIFAGWWAELTGREVPELTRQEADEPTLTP